MKRFIHELIRKIHRRRHCLQILSFLLFLIIFLLCAYKRYSRYALSSFVIKS